MAARVRQIVLDAADPALVARFWSAVLDWPIVTRTESWYVLRHGDLSLAVQRAPGHVPPRWPSPGHSQQVHLDIAVDDIDASEQLILDQGGAKLAEHPEQSPPYRIYTDPAGHPFCLEYRPDHGR
jgi:predicted enzyme related to lactoylglutathione lyase